MPRPSSVTGQKIASKVFDDLEQAGYKLTIEDQDGNEITPSKDFVNILVEAILKSFKEDITVGISGVVTAPNGPCQVALSGNIIIA